jgi:hypothetical protein
MPRGDHIFPMPTLGNVDQTGADLQQSYSGARSSGGGRTPFLKFPKAALNVEGSTVSAPPYPGETHVETQNPRPNAVLSRATRNATMPPREDSQGEKPQHLMFVDLPEKIRESHETGVGKSPGFKMPWSRTWESIIPKVLKQMPPIRVFRELPTRPEQAGWSAAYLKYFEQKTRHVWPGGSSQPGRIIEHPESAPLTAIAPRFRL